MDDLDVRFMESSYRAVYHGAGLSALIRLWTEEHDPRMVGPMLAILTQLHSDNEEHYKTACMLGSEYLSVVPADERCYVVSLLDALDAMHTFIDQHLKTNQ